MHRTHDGLVAAREEMESLTEQVRKLGATLENKVEIEAMAFDSYEDTVNERNGLREAVRELEANCDDLWAWKQQVKKLGFWRRLWKVWPV
jgi:hypothetical protein